jgi:hypothetical protein
VNRHCKRNLTFCPHIALKFAMRRRHYLVAAAAASVHLTSPGSLADGASVLKHTSARPDDSRHDVLLRCIVHVQVNTPFRLECRRCDFSSCSTRGELARCARKQSMQRPIEIEHKQQVDRSERSLCRTTLSGQRRCQNSSKRCCRHTPPCP